MLVYRSVYTREADDARDHDQFVRTRQHGCPSVAGAKPDSRVDLSLYFTDIITIMNIEISKIQRCQLTSTTTC